MTTIQDLNKKEEECYKNCSDYSCVRSGGCTGFAGHAVRDFHHKEAQHKTEEKKYQDFKQLMDRYNKEKCR